MFKRLMDRIFARLLCWLGKKNPLCYIGGTESLPRPLSPEEEAILIEALPHSPDARSQLIERNLRLVVFIAKKFENTGVGIEDLISIGTIGLIKSVNTFRADRQIKLATYASRCIENEILMYLRKTSGQKELSIDEPLHIDWDGNELLLSDVLSDEEDSVSRAIETEEDRRTISIALSHLSPRERQIIEMRFGLRGGRDLTQKEVAAKLGISQSYISRLEKKIIARLRVEMEGKV
jgi:RNA polymerase sporulation-specific sigma factor